MKFYGRVLSSTRKNWLNFGGDLGIVRWVKFNEQKNTVIVVAYRDRGEGNDPEPFFFFLSFFFFRGVGSLSQPRLNIFTVGNMRVMICLGQGGLRSLSASSYYLIVWLSVFADIWLQRVGEWDLLLFIIGFENIYNLCNHFMGVKSQMYSLIRLHSPVIQN